MDQPSRSGHPDRLFHVMLVARVALGVALVSAMGLAATLMAVSHRGGAAYADVIWSFNATRENLGWAFIVACALLVSVSGTLTWLIALYGSFRIAGPLYRFSRNLDAVLDDRQVALVQIRAGDLLQAEARALARGIERLREHLLALEDAAARALDCVSRSDETPPGSLSEALARLRELDRRARL